MKHLLKLLDLSKEEITELLDLADRLKAETKAGVEHHILKGKTLGMIFEKSSTRTRVSFETGGAASRFMNQFCAGAWEHCTIARHLTDEYERKEEKNGK